MKIQSNFFVFVDAGHGGINPTNQQYATDGKRFFHPNQNFHNGGWYYEGVENRIVADLFMKLLAANGIPFVQVHRAWEDSKTELARRANMVNLELQKGKKGYLHSFHSNAIGEEKREHTEGYTIWTTEGQTLSDKIADAHYKHIQQACPDLKNWNWRKDAKKDGDVDYEKDFYILKYTKCPAILEEFGFHTSLPDTLRIVAHRQQRAEAALQTAIFVRDNFYTPKVQIA
jgi:N-acetylmuramoyl-L-alanine amidase